MDIDQNTLGKWLHLALTPGIGPRTFHHLMEHFSTDPEMILQASSSQLCNLGLKLATVRAIQSHGKL